MRTLLTKVNSISENGERTKKKTILSLTEQSLLKIINNTLLVKFNSKLPENKTILARYAKKKKQPQVSVEGQWLNILYI